MKQIFGIQLHDDEYNYVAPMAQSIAESVDEMKLSPLGSKLMRVCALASLIEYRGRMKEFDSELAFMVAIRDFMFTEYEKVALLVDSMSPTKLKGAEMNIGSLTLSFD